MSNGGGSAVHWFDGNSPDIERAMAGARSTFRDFWRELSWERRRIIPAYSMCVVKAMFEEAGKVEHMFVDELDFDGTTIFGVLMNEPHGLTGIHQGDRVQVAFAERVSDWMLVTADDRVFGAFTVQVMRASMAERERAEHDAAWGLDFGDAGSVRLLREPGTPEVDHPMALNMVSSLDEYLDQDPSALEHVDALGLTMLHRESLAGNAPIVQGLLARGANRNARTRGGATALELARSLDWQRVIALFGS